MRVLFCNIAWMKYYNGITEEDKPINGGAYIKENENGGEVYNFRDYNGYCYGFVKLNGDMALEKHYEGVTSNQPYVEDVLVIWVATNKDNETRIVGWYKNATVYRKEQYEIAFTNPSHDLFYRIKAKAKDCYLLPEEERTFPIPRASISGTGMGMGRSNVWYAESQFAQSVLIPKVINYIENYKGKYANIVYSDDVLNQVIDNSEANLGFWDLYEKGYKCYKNSNFLEGLKYFNTARLIEETPDVLFNVAHGLFWLNCFDKAKPLFERVIELEGEKLDTLDRLMRIHDYTRDREKTIYYCNKMIQLFGESKEYIQDKINHYWLMFDIYIYQKDKKKAEEIIDIISSFPDEVRDENLIERLQNTYNKTFKIKKHKRQFA